MTLTFLWKNKRGISLPGCCVLSLGSANNGYVSTNTVVKTHLIKEIVLEEGIKEIRPSFPQEFFPKHIQFLSQEVEETHEYLITQRKYHPLSVGVKGESDAEFRMICKAGGILPRGDVIFPMTSHIFRVS
ncbi:hypothetical protein TNCV_4696341 [Trichonephila clavipes]|nr:hypothetical protein TNCV_4696341 [Trichonephila clavipes]